MTPVENGPQQSLENAELVIVQGDQQEGEVGSTLASPLVVRVLDAGGAPIPGAPVQWTFEQGKGGQGTATSTQFKTVTDTEGNSAVKWQLGEEAGLQDAWAEIDQPDVISTASEGPSTASRRRWRFRARGHAGQVRQVVVSPDSAEIALGGTVDFSATAMDRYHNVVDTATVYWSSSDRSVARVDAEGHTSAVAAGDAVIVARVGDRRGNGYLTVMAEADTIPTDTIPSDTVPPPPPDTIPTDTVPPPPPPDTVPNPSFASIGIVSGNQQSGVVNSRLADPLVIRALDSTGAPFEGLMIRWVFDEGTGIDGTSSGTSLTTSTDANGMVSISWKLGTTAGGQSARAEIVVADDGNTEPTRRLDFQSQALPGVAAEIVLSDTSLDLEVGESATITAAVVDRFGNVIPDADITWSSQDASVATVTESVPSSTGPIG